VKVNRRRRAPRRSTLRQKQIRCIKETNNSQLFLSLRWGASGAAVMAATSRSTSRSPVPRGAGPREMTGATTRSRSPPRGPVRRHLAAVKRPPLEWHDTSGMILPDHLRQGDSGSSKMPQHSPMILENFLLLLGGAMCPTPT
jgi:hypothetical protein